MKKCPTCAREYPLEYNHCPVDASPLLLTDAANRGTPAGKPVDDPPSAYPPQPPSRKGLPVWAWVLIAVCAFLFVVVPILLALIAIPTVISLRKRANDISAIQAIHTIINAENMYEASYPANGFACSLTALAGDPNSGPPNPAAAQLIPPQLASGVQHGYVFTIANCAKVNVSGTDRIVEYTITAVPQRVGATGNRGFCADQSAVIKFDPAGGTHCTQTLGGDDR